MNFVFNKLQEQAAAIIPYMFKPLGDLVAIDGFLIDTVLSMTWADYRNGAKKAKIHLGFNINQSVPIKLFLTNGLKSERQYVSQLLTPEQTGVLDRGYQSHYLFDQWQEQDIKFICRIKASTVKTVIKSNPCKSESIIFYDATVLRGTPSLNQTTESIRLVAYRIRSVEFWIATNRLDLTAEDVAMAYRLRWEIEKFFAWWKRHYESRDAGCAEPERKNISNYFAAKT